MGVEVLFIIIAASALGVVIIASAKAGQAIERYRWRRLESTDAAARARTDDPDRMERLERAVEAIAVELERVGEGQRFVTKLLAERTVDHRLRSPRPGTVRSSHSPVP